METIVVQPVNYPSGNIGTIAGGGGGGGFGGPSLFGEVGAREDFENDDPSPDDGFEGLKVVDNGDGTSTVTTEEDGFFDSTDNGIVDEQETIHPKGATTEISNSYLNNLHDWKPAPPPVPAG